jgi:tetratricopeptide (TPR) repeat protein
MLKDYFFKYLIEQLQKNNFSHVILKTNENIKKYSNEFDFWNIRAIAFTQLKKPKEALLNFEKAYSLDKKNPVPLANIGKLLYEHNKFQEAHAYYLRSYNLDPKYSPALLGVINCLLKQKKYENCIDLINVGIKNHQDLNNEFLYNLLGTVHENIGNLKEAYKFYRKSIIENNNFYPALLNEANYFAATGNTEVAMEKYQNIIKNFPNSSETHRRISIIKKYKDPNDPHLNQMNSLFDLNKNNENILEELGFALSKAYEDLKNYESAYNFFTISNKIRNKKVIYNEKFEEQQFEFIKSLFVNGNNNEADSKSELRLEEQPIFVLGMPRSGSTLVEQILSAHSKVEGLGEIDFFHQSLAKEVNLKSEFDRNTEKVFNNSKSTKVKNSYLKFVKELKKNTKPFFTDKLPLNFKYIGFILQSFPNAIIIHTDRNPKDIFVSILKNFFGQLQMNFAYKEEYIVHYINCYKNYMDLWKKLYPHKIYNIKYDILINEFEKEVTSLLEYCGLSVENNCFQFNKNKKTVLTASINQVRQPIYNSSEKAYMNYEKFLGKYLRTI